MEPGGQGRLDIGVYGAGTYDFRMKDLCPGVKRMGLPYRLCPQSIRLAIT